MIVKELIEQLGKLNPNAQVYMYATRRVDGLVPAMSMETYAPNTCVIRDHVLQRISQTIKIGDKMYEVVEQVTE